MPEDPKIHTIRAEEDPTLPPPDLAMHYVNTVTKAIWLSAGIDTVDDWILIVPASRTVTVGPGLVGGGALDDDISISIADTDVTEGTYRNPLMTVNSRGQVTDISEGLTGNDVVRRLTIGIDAITDSTFDIPDLVRVIEVRVVITTAYDNNARISVGKASSPSCYATDNKSYPAAIGTYVFRQDVFSGLAAAPLRVSISNNPTVGAGEVVIKYLLP
jgi:hypothetical protein